MKKFLFSLVLCFSLTLMAEEIFLDRTIEESKISVLEENFSRADNSYIKIECRIKSIIAEEVATPNGTFTKVFLPGFHETKKVGSPQLPAIHRLIEVPLKAKVSVDVLYVVEREFTLAELGAKHPIYPAQPSIRRDQKNVEFAYDAASYEQGYSKDSFVRVTDAGIFRDYRLVLLEIIPGNYNAKAGKLKFYERVDLLINMCECDMEETKKVKQKYSSIAFDTACRAFIKSPTLGAFARSGELKYLIVSDPMFKNALQPFIDHKLARGYKVAVKYTDEIGNTTTQIKSYIQGEYDSPSDSIAPTFVLLVGDKEQIPTFTATAGSFVTDLYYVTLAGNDFKPDCLVGRFSAKTVQQLTPQIEKTVAYESGSLADYSFLKRTVLVAGWDSYWAVKRGYPQIRYGTKYFFTTQNGFVDIEQNTFLSAGSQQNVGSILAAVNRGVGFFNYTAHGTETTFHDPAFTRADVDALNNAGMYPVVIGNCCLTNSIQIDDCFGERWLRAANKGAVGFIGGSSYTYWNEDMWWGTGACTINADIDKGNAPRKEDCGVGAYQTAFEMKEYFCNSGMMLAGNIAVSETDSDLIKYYFEVYHLLGDPGLPSYWATPNNPPKNNK